MDVAELVTFTCDSCSGTYTGKPHEIDRLGWIRKPLKHKREFWLCGDCVKHFDPIWHPAKEAA